LAFSPLELGKLGMKAHLVETLDNVGSQCTESYPKNRSELSQSTSCFFSLVSSPEPGANRAGSNLQTLRHTAATWLMQAGVDRWEAAGFLGMSVEMLDRVYGHHHLNHLRKAAHAIGYGRRRQSLSETLAGDRARRPLPSQRTENIGGPGRTATT
jgi:hypothetical protein